MTDTLTAPAAADAWRTDPGAKCLNCDQPRAGIRRDGLICGLVGYDGELECEFPRHRFKPWTQRELDAHRRSEAEVARQMGDMADWWYQKGQFLDLDN